MKMRKGTMEDREEVSESQSFGESESRRVRVEDREEVLSTLELTTMYKMLLHFGTLELTTMFKMRLHFGTLELSMMYKMQHHFGTP